MTRTQRILATVVLVGSLSTIVLVFFLAWIDA